MDKKIIVCIILLFNFYSSFSMEEEKPREENLTLSSAFNNPAPHPNNIPILYECGPGISIDRHDLFPTITFSSVDPRNAFSFCMDSCLSGGSVQTQKATLEIARPDFDDPVNKGIEFKVTGGYIFCKTLPETGYINCNTPKSFKFKSPIITNSQFKLRLSPANSKKNLVCKGHLFIHEPEPTWKCQLTLLNARLQIKYRGEIKPFENRLRMDAGYCVGF